MKLYVGLFFFIWIQPNLAYYTFKNSPIEMINHKKWKKIASGKDPWIWMINFYCKKGGKGVGKKCDKSYNLRNEFTDAANMLKGIVKPAALKVNADFPAFVRIPSVMVYLPNSTEPYVYEMNAFPEQVKRPAFNLVQYIQNVITNHIDSAPIRNIVSSWKFAPMGADLMQKVVSNDVPNQCYFILLYENIRTDKKMIQALATVATAAKDVYGIPEAQLNFGAANFKKVKRALKDWDMPYVVPKFWFLGPRNSPQNKQLTFAYHERIDSADIIRWVIGRHVDMMKIPTNAVQINVKKEAGFVGQIIELEGNKFFLGTN